MIASCKAQKQHRVPRWCWSALTSYYDTLYFALSRPRCEEVWYTCCVQKGSSFTTLLPFDGDFVISWRRLLIRCEDISGMGAMMLRHTKQKVRGKTWKFNPKTTLFWMIFPSLLHTYFKHYIKRKVTTRIQSLSSRDLTPILFSRMWYNSLNNKLIQFLTNVGRSSMTRKKEALFQANWKRRRERKEK